MFSYNLISKAIISDRKDFCLQSFVYNCVFRKKEKDTHETFHILKMKPCFEEEPLTEPSLLEPGTGAGGFPNSCVMSTLFLKRAPLISSFVSPLGFLKFFFRLDTICVLPVKIILQNHY